MDDLSPRLRAVCDLDVATVREEAGRHEYDGQIQDLSPDGIRSGLARIGGGRMPARGRSPRRGAPRRHRTGHANRPRGRLELHRGNPLVHLSAMDLACYDRDYAPAAQRRAARLAHLRSWPDAVDAAVAALDRVSAEVASALSEWGSGFSLPRFHRAVLEPGAPPLGLLGTAVERG